MNQPDHAEVLAQLTKPEVDILWHTLGIRDDGTSAWNRFMIYPISQDYPAVTRLVRLGLLTLHDRLPMTRLEYFKATDLGAEVVKLTVL